MSRLQITLILLVTATNLIHKDHCKANNPKERELAHRRDTEGIVNNNAECGRPLPIRESFCIPFSKRMYPNCDSFPAKPKQVEVDWFVHNHTSPVIQVKWRPPVTGFTDLWGFQVYLLELTWNRPGRFVCKQINSKEKGIYTLRFTSVSFGGTYKLRLQSMPANNGSNTVTRELVIDEQCEINEFKARPVCCSFLNITHHVIKRERRSSVVVNVTWNMTCDYVTKFELFWMAFHEHENCDGWARVQNKTTFAIELSRECTSYNYTVKIFGIITEHLKTEAKQIQVILPSWPTTAPSHTSNSSPLSQSLEIIIISTAAGLVIGAFLGMIFYKLFKRQGPSRIRLPSSDNNDDSETFSQGNLKVLLIHAQCCNPCREVVYRLWDYLQSVEQLDIRLDMLCEPKLRENPLRWYELEIKTADRIVIVTSSAMSSQDMDSPVDSSSDHIDTGNCGINVKHQLNLLRGDIGHNSDTSKYIPVYFNYSGSGRDAPPFLSMLNVYRLPSDLNNVLLHLLGISPLRRHSTKPWVYLPTDKPPFIEKMDALIKAENEAKRSHQARENPRSTIVHLNDPGLDKSRSSVV